MTLDLCLLGRFELRRDGGEVSLHPQDAVVLAMLAANPGQPVHPHDLAKGLWGRDLDGLDEQTYLSRLRNSLPAIVSHLRKVLRDDAAIPSVRQRGGRYVLEGIDPEAVDHLRFQERVREAERLLTQHDVEGALSRFAAAEGEWRGEPFAMAEADDIDLSPILKARRDQLQAECRRMRTRWAEAAAQHGHYQELRQHLDQWLLESPEVPLFWFLCCLTALDEEGPDAARAVLRRWPKASSGKPGPRDHDPGQLRRRADYVVSLASTGTPRTLPGAIPPESPTLLIGRPRELDELRQFVAALIEGVKGLLMLEGVGGIGKTRLLIELRRLATDAGIRVASTVCELAPAGLGPWREILGPLWLEALRDVTLGGEVLVGADQLLALLVESPIDGPPPQPDNDPQLSRLEPLVATILSHAATRPLLLIFDDADRIDVASLRLLRDTWKDLAGSGAAIGIVAAIRPTDLDPAGPVAGWREQLRASRMLPLEVPAFGRPEVRAWLSEIGGVPRPSDDLVDRTLHRTGGRPLLMEHVSLDPEPDNPNTLGAPDEPRVPVKVRQVLLPAFQRRSPQCGRWLEAAAVAATGQRFDVTMVKEMLAPSLSSRAADSFVDEACGAGIIGADGRQFENDLWRDVIIEQLPTRRRRRLHARGYQVLHDRAARPGALSAELAVRIAHHAFEGREHLPSTEVAEAGLTAARSARRRSAYELAIALCQRALEVADGLEQVFELLVERGDAEHDAGNVAAAEASYVEANELAAARGDYDRQALAAMRSARLWWIPLRANQSLHDRLQAALKGLGTDTGLLRAQVEAHLACTLMPEGADLDRRNRLARSALQVVDQVDDPEVLCEILLGVRWGLYETAPPGELLQLAQRLKRVSARVNSEHLQGEGLAGTIVDLLRLGRLREAKTTIEEHRDRAARNRRPLSLYLQRTFDAMMAQWEGAFDRAWQLIGEIVRDMSDLSRVLPLGSEMTIRQLITAQTGWLLHEQGQTQVLKQQEETVVAMVAQTGDSPMWRAALAMLYCDTDDHRQAAEIVDGIIQESDGLRTFPPHGWAVPALYLIAEVCSELHREDSVALQELGLATGRLRALLEPHIGEFALGGTPAVLVGPVSRAAGLIALADGDMEAALYLLGSASQEASPSGKPVLARLHLDQARVFLTRGQQDDREAAIRHLEQAVRGAEKLGMQQLSGRGRNLLDDVNG